MTSRPTRSLGILVALTALVAGALAISPAQAATSAIRISDTAAVYKSGETFVARVPVTCLSSKACAGTITFDFNGSTSSTWNASYSISGKRSEYVTVKIAGTNPTNPLGTNYEPGKAARFIVSERLPSKKSTTHPVKTEVRVLYGEITGTFGGFGTGPTDPKVRLQAVSSKGTSVSRVVRPTNGSFTFDKIPLGANNAPSGYYVMSVEGDVAGQHRSWYWRGSFDDSLGGTKEVREASRIRVTATTPSYRANVRYGEIAGSMGAPGEVTIATAPFDSVAPASRIAHGLDIDSCANVQAFVRTGASGSYRASFLPTSEDGGDKRYLVSGDDGVGSTVDRWYGQTGSFGSCLHARGYSTAGSATTNLLALDGPFAVNKTFSMTGANAEVTVDPSWSATAYQSDKVVTLREKVPGEPVLKSPVWKTQTAFDGSTKFEDVPPGEYWVEVGREVSCGGWVASRYPDNNLYLKGEDRGAERWKTVSGKYAEYQKSIDMGYKPSKTPPRGYKGWMYRQVCKATGPTQAQGGAIGRGTINTVIINNDNDVETIRPSVGKGAYVTGRVTRVGGKSNKELMVTLYSTSGTLVKRQALTDGSGRFKITGLATGNYRVSVNTDSWRGIGRGFYGAKTKRVTAGRGYSIGTLKFTS